MGYFFFSSTYKNASYFSFILGVSETQRKKTIAVIEGKEKKEACEK